MSYDPSLFNVDPYYDDFSESKKFLRVMFKPGFALQAREVTQLQTILQNQIDRFGKHIFENGSTVLDGQISENYLRFARIGSLTGFTDPTVLVGSIVSGASTAKARIIHAENALPSTTIDNYPVVFFEYLEGGATFTANGVLSGTAANNLPISFSLTGKTDAPTIGEATVISADSGVRFVDGYFVLHDAQMIAAKTITGPAGQQRRVFSNPTTRIGFHAKKSFVNSNDDSSLNDPAFGYYNYSAPGADRFKIDLGLTQCDFDPSNVSNTTNFARTDFLEVIRLVNGEIVKKESYPEYAVIEDTLARRTFDESGNYTVEPFDLNMTYRDVTFGITGATLSAELSQGKAYVFGYEFETQSTNALPVPRARTTKSQTDQTSIGGFGPYLMVSTSNRLLGGGLTDNGFTGFDMSKQELMYFSSGASGTTFTGIGSARVRGLFPSGTNYSLYLYDISMSGSSTLENARTIWTSENAIHGAMTGAHAFSILWNGATGTLLNPNDSGMLFSFPKGNRIQKIDEVNYAVTNFRKIDLPANGATKITTGTSRKLFSLNPSSEVTTPSADLFILSSTGAAVPFTARVNSSLGELAITAAGSGNKTVNVFYSTDMAGGVDTTPTYLRKTKTLVTETITGMTFAAQTDPRTGRNFIYIGKGLTAYTDVVSVSSITGTLNAISGEQLINYFSFDSGQRDNYYDWSRLIFNSNARPSSTSISPNFGITGSYALTLTRFVHSGSMEGPFTRDSYSCEYKDIPVYVSPETGRSYRLSDVLDFRPVKAADGSLTGCVMPVPVGSANDNKFDYTHYLPRTDKIAIGKDRNFKVISGIPSLEASPPSDDPESMTLYTVTLNGYTTDKDDVQIKRIENKRYTMQDIAQLEDRLDAVEYFTNLTLLEQQANNIQILDSDGVEIPKKGILVDSFRGHSISDVQDPMYSASIDYENGEMRPAFRNRVYKMDTVRSTSNVVGSTDNIYTLQYTTSPLINQPLATTSLNVNPSGVFTYLGYARVTPSRDFWYDDSIPAVVRVNTDGENDSWAVGYPLGTGPGEAKGFGTQWNDWESNWSGISRVDDSVSSSVSTDRSIFVTQSGSRISPPTSTSSIIPNSIVNTIGNLQVKTDVLPYARSIQVSIDCKNLKPSTTMYLFMDGVRVNLGATTLTTGLDGSLSFNFTIPQSSFNVGKKSIRVTDSQTNNLLETTTAADCVLSLQGTWGNYKDGIVTTRTVQSRRESVRSERIVTNIFGRTIQRSGFTKLVGFTDPLSQSFFVDPAIYPSGVFAKTITLFFNSVDTNPDTPISLVLKPVVNGYPHPSKFIPLSDVTKTASSITTTTNAATGTDFEFTSPIYLAPGEYAFSLTTPSNNFSVYTSQIGASVIKQSLGETTTRATKQPYARSIFKNQTSSGLQKSDVEDIKFLIHLCKFTATVPATVIVENTGASFYGPTAGIDAIRYNIPSILPTDSSLTVTENGLINSEVDTNKTLYLPSSSRKTATTNYTTLTFNMETENTFVSPVIDLDSANVYCIENRINRPSTYGFGLPFSGETGSTNLGVPLNDRYVSRYITKKVVLEPNMSATNLRVQVLASKPSETDFAVYARMSPENGTGLPFDLREYVQMVPAADYPSTAVGQSQEMSFSLTGQAPFQMFAVKIVMTTSNNSIVPTFKNLRIVSA